MKPQLKSQFKINVSMKVKKEEFAPKKTKKEVKL